MTDIRDFLDKASNLSVQQAWISGFVNNKMLQLEILELIKTRLRETGTNSFGQVIGTYSPFTEKINPKKEAGTHYTFDDTGEFLNSMQIHAFANYFFITADADKGEDNLFKKYGEEIIGIDSITDAWLQERIIEKFREYVNFVLFGY